LLIFYFLDFNFWLWVIGWKWTANGTRFTLDLFEKMPYHSLTKEERQELWDDGLHFTAAGYAKIGSLVAERLIEIMKEEEARAGKELGR
jgi:lysophospholipase L1-like esterase